MRRSCFLILSALLPALAAPPSSILIDFPEPGALFPKDIAPPTFLWRDNNPDAASWLLEIAFAGSASPLKLWSSGDKMKIGEIDSKLHDFVPPTLTPQEAETHTWKPDAKTWAAIVARVPNRSGNP